MPENYAALQRAPELMREPLRQYAELVREIAGSNAQALSLFGAVVAGNFDPDRRTAQSVLVVEKVELSVLRRLAEHGTQLGKRRISAPLVMTPDYIQASRDTFPLELIEIKQMHVTLFGPDHFDQLQFQDPHVRLQCERELKAVLIGLRQGLLASAGREKLLGTVDAQVAGTLVRTLRGMLWLKGRRDGKPGHEVVRDAETLLDRKLSGLTAVLDPSGDHGWAEFEKLYRDVEALGEKVNSW